MGNMRISYQNVLLLLSHFSRVRLCATTETAAHQASLSLGFSRQEHWYGLPFASPRHESESEVTQSCLTASDPMDCSPPGSSIHGIFQARVLEWVAIAFSDPILLHLSCVLSRLGCQDIRPFPQVLGSVFRFLFRGLCLEGLCF